MKRAIFIFLSVVLLITGCGQRSDNIRFTATVDSVGDNSIMITTVEGVDFDKASVGFGDGLELTFNLLEGQTVAIEALPLIRESYPVQITAVKITLKEETEKVEYKRITPKEAMEMMGEGVIILDVRTQEEFDEGHIPNAILLTNTEIAEKAGEVLPDKDQIILVYCRSGRRSAAAAKELIKMGYTKVYDFGGILDWPGEIVK